MAVNGRLQILTLGAHEQSSIAVETFADGQAIELTAANEQEGEISLWLEPRATIELAQILLSVADRALADEMGVTR